jgi:AcrR family transcriptional regulator
VTETTRDRILACACDLYLRDGVDGFSMRKLARSVGVTAPALYRHFEGREKLLLQVVGEGYKVQIQYLHRALAGQSPAQRFRMAGWEYLNFALEHPRYYQILYSYTQFLGSEVDFSEIEPLVVQVHQFWLDRVQECISAGLLKEEDPEAIARSFWALAHGLISIHQKRLLGLSEEEFREVYMRSATHLLAGVGVLSGWDAVN